MGHFVVPSYAPNHTFGPRVVDQEVLMNRGTKWPLNWLFFASHRPLNILLFSKPLESFGSHTFLPEGVVLGS